MARANLMYGTFPRGCREHLLAFMELDEELARLIGGPQYRKSSIWHGRISYLQLDRQASRALGLESFPTLLVRPTVEETTATTHRSAAALSLLGRG